MIRRVLIANRGEVAVRIIRACRELGIETVLVYSDADAHSLAVSMADQAIYIGAAPAAESYLRKDKILEAATQTNCDAVHPGFGFLSENAEFASLVREAGLIFIGPDPDAIRTMGIKTKALELARQLGIPTVPNYREDQDRRAIEFPVLLKAAAGGGGKGMRIVREQGELAEALESVKREAQKAFADDRVYMEKYIERARHVEVQIFGDQHGNVIHLFERDCSTQRRYQKIIEESPSPFLMPDLREQLCAAAVKLGQSVQYANAGTVEFIVDETAGRFYFMEMNTRLQVEHPVTELVTGIDLVKLQFHVANDLPLPFTQADITTRGHAIECRIYAEDPANSFLPSIGMILKLVEPQAPGVRVDSGVISGDEISIHYDPMIAKLIVQGQDRREAIRRMEQALAQFVIMGLTTNIHFLGDVLRHPVFSEGRMTTRFIESGFSEWQAATPTPTDVILIAAALGELLRQQTPQQESDTALDRFSAWSQRDSFRVGG
ncbi:MAG: acetyl-CoA carboxylase biotin carboxylase subunit [Anaerolineae bacterium]|nr:acetyl-CoA carboxylase biotin carboxylase subunit [Anaerolineae bacterium]